MLLISDRLRFEQVKAKVEPQANGLPVLALDVIAEDGPGRVL